MLLCIQTGKTVDDENRMRYEPQELLPPQRGGDGGAVPAATRARWKTPQKIAELCNLEFTFGKYHLPEFKLPEGYDSFSYLKKLCDEGYQAAVRRGRQIPGAS